MVLAFPIRVVAGIGGLAMREFVALGFEEEAGLVDTPYLLYGVLFRLPTVRGYGVPYLVCDTRPGGTRAEDHYSYVL